MSLPVDLLEQARHLSRREPRRPRQASLRRAISSAYYAVFHLLVDEGSRLLASGSGVKNLRGMFSRSFTHDEMKLVCQQLSNGVWPSKVKTFAAMISVPPELQNVAQTFVELQESRHLADYDIGARFSRTQVVGFVNEAQRLFDDWELVRSDPSAGVFLATMFAYRKIKG